MNVVTVPLFVILTVLTVLVFAFGVRRLLGMPFSLVRTLAAGVFAFLIASPIITAVGGPAVSRKHPSVFPALWFVFLGLSCAVMAGMVFLVVAEALVPSGSLPGPLHAVRGARSLAGRIRRYLQITVILIRRGLWPYLRGGRRAEFRSAQGRERLARSLVRALEEGGVTFIKLGQVLSTRRDLLPAEFTDALSRLQDRAAEVPWPQIEQVLDAELGGAGSAAFAEFDRAPLAAASIAQVHAARLRSGEEVVVKVRRPGVRAVAERDLDIIGRLARIIERNTPWGRGIGAAALAEGFADALREEMDLRVEARNMAAVAAAAAGRRSAGGLSGIAAGTAGLAGVAATGRPAAGPQGTQRDAQVEFPAPDQSLCTAGVLVMRRLRGVPLSAAAPGRRQAAGLARVLLDCLLTQIVVDGVFHADPHPGNILLLEDGRLGMLDFGSVGRLDPGLRRSLERLMLALDRGDPRALADSLLDVVERPGELDEYGLERAIGRFMARHLAPGAPPDLSMFTDLFRIVVGHGLRIPAEIAAVFRALAIMEGTLTQLDPAFDVIAGARDFAGRQLADQLSPAAIRDTVTDELAALLPVLRRVPRHVDRIAGALEAGRLNVNVRLLADRAERQIVTGLLHQALITVLAASAGIMAVLMLGLHGGPRITPLVSLYQFLGYCLLVVAAILALRVLVLIFRSNRALPSPPTTWRPVPGRSPSTAGSGFTWQSGSPVRPALTLRQGNVPASLPSAPSTRVPAATGVAGGMRCNSWTWPCAARRPGSCSAGLLLWPGAGRAAAAAHGRIEMLEGWRSATVSAPG